MEPLVLGVRHHGPGSARSVQRVLERAQPDCVLVEGPPDADALLPLLAHPGLVPPVAVLCHAADDPHRSAFWPLARFSPELVAVRWALAAGADVRFCDLPAGELIGDRRSRGGGDPLAALAAAGGYGDPERWWEDLVEARGGDDESVFDAVAEAMEAAREAAPPDPSSERREAAMRLAVRAARRRGASRVAVVCGAWHTTGLRGSFPSEASDRVLVRGTGRSKVVATLVPWSASRLSQASGYGAGVASPGWYAHLYEEPADPVPGWMARAARALRDEGVDAAPSGAVDAARLAEALAAVRHRPAAGLDEVTDAARAALCNGDDLVLGLLGRRLVVGEQVGRVPDEAPATPLVADVRRRQRRLRLPLHHDHKELDLRSATDRERSHLLHRLRLLDVHWGVPTRNLTGVTGTYRETWRLAWEPEVEVDLVAASLWGTTVEEAATGRATDRAWAAGSLTELVDLVQRALLADLPDAAVHVVAALEVRAAVAADVHLLLQAVPALVRVLRYGTVRRTDADAVRHVVDGMADRVAAGLVAACQSLDDDAAATTAEAVAATDAALALLDDPSHLGPWRQALGDLARSPTVHGRVSGKATRLLLDARSLHRGEASRLVGLALSTGEGAARAGAWVEGFLTGSGLVLVHDDDLWHTVDRWVDALDEERFVEVLPLLRRTFATFPPAERRALGERAAAGDRPPPTAGPGDGGALDPRRVAMVLPVLRQVLGLPAPPHPETDGG